MHVHVYLSVPIKPGCCSLISKQVFHEYPKPSENSPVLEATGGTELGVPDEAWLASRWVYLVFFFCGEPIPPWPGGLAYLAVRLRGKAEKRPDKRLTHSEDEEQ